MIDMSYIKNKFWRQREGIGSKLLKFMGLSAQFELISAIFALILSRYGFIPYDWQYPMPAIQSICRIGVRTCRCRAGAVRACGLLYATISWRFLPCRWCLWLCPLIACSLRRMQVGYWGRIRLWSDWSTNSDCRRESGWCRMQERGPILSVSG